jgi:hypothetical protein
MSSAKRIFCLVGLMTTNSCLSSRGSQEAGASQEGECFTIDNMTDWPVESISFFQVDTDKRDSKAVVRVMSLILPARATMPVFTAHQTCGTYDVVVRFRGDVIERAYQHFNTCGSQSLVLA